MTERIDFKSMTPEELTAWCKDQGQPAFRGKQLFQWLSRGVASTEEMTDVPQGPPGQDRPGRWHQPAGGGPEAGLKAGRHHKISVAAGRWQLY